MREAARTVIPSTESARCSLGKTPETQNSIYANAAKKYIDSVLPLIRVAAKKSLPEKDMERLSKYEKNLHQEAALLGGNMLAGIP